MQRGEVARGSFRNLIVQIQNKPYQKCETANQLEVEVLGIDVGRELNATGMARTNVYSGC